MAGVILPTVRALDQGPATVVKLPHACVLPKVPIKLVKQLRPVNAIGKALAIDQFIVFLSIKRGIEKVKASVSTHHFFGDGQVLALLQIHVIQLRHVTPIVCGGVSHEELIEGTEATGYTSRQANAKNQQLLILSKLSNNWQQVIQVERLLRTQLLRDSFTIGGTAIVTHIDRWLRLEISAISQLG